jgi:hypothetical protein
VGQEVEGYSDGAYQDYESVKSPHDATLHGARLLLDSV